MIKLLHLADLHLGVENYGRIDPQSGLHTRLQDYLERLDEAIDAGLAFGADLVLIAGDIYKSRTPNPTQQREFARRIRRLTSAGLPVFILTGNHDVSPSAGRAHSVEIFDTLAVDGVIIADRPRSYRIDTRNGPLQLLALPWVSRHGLLTRDEMRSASISEIETTLRARLALWVEREAEALDTNYPAVLAFHGTVDGATLGAERGMLLGADLSLPRSALTPPGIDYVALGHIHKHQALGDQPPLVYPGSIERIDFGEEDDPKGCVLVELEPGHACWRFQQLNARPFVTIRVDVRAVSDAVERVHTAIERASLNDAIVRVQIKATPQQNAQLREDQLRQQLEQAGAWHVAAVSIEIERSARGRFAGLEQELAGGLTPLRALELYLKSKQPALSAERINQLLAAAEELLREES